MKEIYEKWHPLGEDFSFLRYIGMENIYAGSLKIYFEIEKNNDSFYRKKIVVDFENQPISYKVGDESYRQRTILALPTLGTTSFFISNSSYFLSDFYDDAGEIYKDVEFEHLLIVTPNTMFDFILDERPNVYTIDL